MGMEGPGGVGITLGKADGFIVKYNSTAQVSITAGSFEANGKNYTLAADAVHVMTSLGAAFDFHYIYIDNSASSSPVATIIDSSTDPAWSDSKRGWYNGNDRCIGVIYSPAASATVGFFSTSVISDKLIHNEFDFSGFNLALNISPTGTWQTPTVSESSAFLPVNAVEAVIKMANADAGAACDLAWLNNEAAVIQNAGNAATFRRAQIYNTYAQWSILGASRNIKIYGAADDDNTLSAWVNGYGYSR